jgi:predicted metal-dependent hydrolase
MRRKSRKLNKIIHKYDEIINKTAQELLYNYDKRLSVNSIKGYVTDTTRGMAYGDEKIYTVPFWSYKRSKKYFTYYVAHELSHIIQAMKYKYTLHDEKFYDIFKRICPTEFQHYELHYKKSAGRYGIRKSNRKIS